MTGSGHGEEELVVTAGTALSRQELAQRPGEGASEWLQTGSLHSACCAASRPTPAFPGLQPRGGSGPGLLRGHLGLSWGADFEKQAPTLSKRPNSQMSCSRALVLMAMVKRT